MGMTTSLDMAMPSAETTAKQADWPLILAHVLPDVDVFIPSLEEMMILMNKEHDARFLAQRANGERVGETDVRMIRELAARLLSYGCGLVALKLGAFGVYMRTSGDAGQRLFGAAAAVQREPWNDRELWAPCFQTRVAGTTGAGDCAIAGFLKGIRDGLPPESTLTGAVAVGACSVERADAASGVIPWPDVWARIGNGWARLPLNLHVSGWTYEERFGIWTGPADKPITRHGRNAHNL